MEIATIERLPEGTDAAVRVYRCKGCHREMRLAVWPRLLHWQMGTPFPQLAKLTALHCRALNDALAVHLKQKHFCEGFVPKHTFVDLRSFRPSIRCGHGDHSLTHRKASQNQCAPGISQANFFGHR